MSINQRPGVYITESAVQSLAVGDTPSDAIAAFVGQTYSGPTQSGVGVPTAVTSWSQFVTQFGGFSDTSLALPFAVFNFFNNGGSLCYVTRVLGASAVAATKTLADRGATPQNTLSLTALNEGAWGNSLRVEVVDRSTGRFDLRIYLGGSAASNIVETWTDLSMTNSDARYVVNVLNAVGAGSSYVVAADLNSTNATPADTPLAGLSTAFTSGSNGSAVASGDYANTVSALDQVQHSLTLNIPAVSSVTIINSAIAYCEGRGDVFLVIDPTAGQTPAQAITEQATYTASSYAAYYYPWIVMNDPSSAVPNATRNTAPGGAVMGVIASTDLAAGAWQAPAGLRARLSGAFNLERKLASTDLDSLNANYINAIRNHPVGGICVFGARTLSKSTSVRYVPVRRELIYIKDNVKRLLDPYIFENNDSSTWLSVSTTLTQFLSNEWSQGGLAGATSDQAFYVVCDETNNTPATIAAGELHATIGVALESPTEFIVINIGQWQGGSTAFEA